MVLRHRSAAALRSNVNARNSFAFHTKHLKSYTGSRWKKRRVYSGRLARQCSGFRNPLALSLSRSLHRLILPWIREFNEFNSKPRGDLSMLKKVFLIAGVALALVTAVPRTFRSLPAILAGGTWSSSSVKSGTAWGAGGRLDFDPCTSSPSSNKSWRCFRSRRCWRYAPNCGGAAFTGSTVSSLATWCWSFLQALIPVLVPLESRLYRDLFVASQGLIVAF